MKSLVLMEKLGRPVNGIIHVGANRGQEAAFYKDIPGIACVYIEPIADVFAQLEAAVSCYPGHVAIKALVSDQEGEEAQFNIANNEGESSSMLSLGEHSRFFPHIEFVKKETMLTTTLDKIVSERFADEEFNLLVIDTQGAELKVLRGASNLLSQIDGIFVEVSHTPLYVGSCTFDDIVTFLRPHGFRPMWMEISQFQFGDAFFLREATDQSAALPPPPSENLARGRPARQSSYSTWSRENDAAGGNDGVHTGRFGFHTDLEFRPWWEVDLGSQTPINQIRIYNRVDDAAASARAYKLGVFVSSDGLKWTKVHDQGGKRFGGKSGKPLCISLVDVSARFVRIQLGDRQYLHLDEVEIY